MHRSFWVSCVHYRLHTPAALDYRLNCANVNNHCAAAVTDSTQLVEKNSPERADERRSRVMVVRCGYNV